MKKLILFIAVFLTILNIVAQNNPASDPYGITTPFVELDTLTTAQRDAYVIRGNKRRIIYHKNTDTNQNQLEVWDGDSWESLGSGGSGSGDNIYTADGTTPDSSSRFFDLGLNSNFYLRNNDYSNYIYFNSFNLELRNTNGNLRFRTGTGGSVASNSIGDVWTATSTVGDGHWSTFNGASLTANQTFSGLNNFTSVLQVNNLYSASDFEINGDSYIELSAPDNIVLSSAYVDVDNTKIVNLETGTNPADATNLLQVQNLIAAAAATGHTIQENDTNLTDRANLSFGDRLIAEDDAANDRTTVRLDTTNLVTLDPNSPIKFILWGGTQAQELAQFPSGVPNNYLSVKTDAVSTLTASGVINVPSGNLIATDVQSALNELQTDINTRLQSANLSTYMDLPSAQTVTGAKNFEANLTVNTNWGLNLGDDGSGGNNAISTMFGDLSTGVQWRLFDGDLTIKDGTINDRFIFQRTTGNFTATGNATANSFIKSGGTGINVLLDDGSTTPISSLGSGDGSETKINAGTNITVSGSGTTGSPYVINSTASGGSATTSLITDIVEYATASVLPSVIGNETDTYAMVTMDVRANNGAYAIVNGAWKLKYHQDELHLSGIKRASVNEMNLKVPLVTSTTDATEDGIIIGYKFNTDNIGVVSDANYFITDFIPFKAGEMMVTGSNRNYWLFDKDKQPLPASQVDYSLDDFASCPQNAENEIGYIRWAEYKGGAGSFIRLGNLYENNPGQQIADGYVDYNGKAKGRVQLTGGSSGSVSSITVNSVEVMSGAVNYTTSIYNTCSLIADNINAHTSTPNYNAKAIMDYVHIWTEAEDGAEANGYVVVASSSGITTGGIQDFRGGISGANYTRDNEKYVFDDNGIIWKKPTNNLFDYRDAEYARAYGSTGAITTSWASSGFIPCKGSRPYTINQGSNLSISYWTADKTFISGTSDWDGFVTPANCRYFTVQMSKITNFKNVKITQSTYTQPIFYNDTGEDVVRNNYFTNTSFCLIADSIGDEGSTYATQSSYGSMMANTLGISDFINVSVSGKSLNQFAADINTGRQNMPTVDVYIIALSTNDHAYNRPIGSISDTSSANTFYGDMQELVEKLQVLNADAKFIFITNGRRGASMASEYNAVTDTYLEDFANATVSFSLLNNFDYVNLYKNGLANPQRSVINTNYYVLADGTHLNDEGHAVYYYPLVTTEIKKYTK